MGKGGAAQLNVKQVNVKFGSGEEVLNAYWGFLSDGGLVIPDQDDFDEGQAVRLCIHIASLSQQYDLGGRVVRRQAGDRQAIVAFDHGEPHDMLLTAALSETDDVPARRYQRYAVSLPAEVRGGAEDAHGQLIDVSAGGCCVRLDTSADGALGVGAEVSVETQSFQARGIVVWARGRDRGVSFDAPGQWAVTQFIGTL